MAKLPVLIVTLFVFTLTAGLPEISKQMKNGEFNPLNLHFVGAIEGMSYFAEANKTMTWYEAKAYCETTNMELATIKTAAQSSGLNTLMLEAYQSAGFWTAATELRSIAGLSWNGNSSEPLVESAFGYVNILPVGNYYCGYLTATSNTYPHMNHYLCSYGLRVLCQTAN